MRNILVKYFKGDSIIWGVMVLLAIISMMAVYSSTGTLAYKYQGGNTSYYMLKQGVFLMLGFGLAFLLHRVHYKFYSRLSVLLMPVAVVLLVLTLFSGSNLNDASRWLRVPFVGLTFQPSEFAKYILVMYVARHLSKHQSEHNPPKEAFWPVVIGLGAICAPIISEDFSTAFLITFVVFSMMLVGRIPLLYLGGTVLSGVVLVAFLILLAPHFPNNQLFHRVDTWISRVDTHMDEKNADSDKSYQATQAKIAVASGGVLGRGPGNSRQRDFLPHPYSDFIYAIILEEYGLAGGFFILIFYVILLYRIGVIVKKASSTFPAFLAMGLGMALVFQAFFHMAVCVNLVPVTGQTLPLVSMGGTSLLLTCMAFGIILSVSRFSVKEEESVQKSAETEEELSVEVA